MGFDSEASKVRAGLSSGAYEKTKQNPLKGFFDQVAVGYLKRDEAKRIEDLETKKENKIRDRAIAKKQATADALLAKQTRLANLYLTQSVRDKTAANVAAVLSIVQDGEITGIADLHDNMAKYTTYTEGEGQVQIEDLDARQRELDMGMVTEMDGGALGTLKPKSRSDAAGPNEFMELDPIMKDGPETNPGTITFTGKKPEDISKAIAGIKSAADWTAINNEANAMTDGETKTRILAALQKIQPQFFNDAKSDQSDYFAGLKTSADFEAKRLQIETMPDSDLKTNRLARFNELLDNKIAAQVTEDATGDISPWFAGITTEEQWLSKKTEADSMNDGVLKERYLAQLAIIKEQYPADALPVPKFMSDTLSKTNITSHRVALNAAIAELTVIPDDKKTKEQVLRLLAFTSRLALMAETQDAFNAQDDSKNDELKLTDVSANVKVTPILEVDGADVKQPEVEMYLTQLENGNWRNIQTGRIYSQDEVVSVGFTNEALKNAAAIANKVEGDLNIPLLELRADTTVLSRTALALDKFVEKNEGILLLSGGKAAEIITQIGKEIQQIASYLGGQNLSDAEFKKQLLAETNTKVSERMQEGGISESAALYAQWTALNIKHAFSFAKLDLGSSGQALSNLDYKNAVKINNAGLDYKTYSTNLRARTRDVILAATEKYAGILTGNTTHNIAMGLPAYKNAFNQSTLQKLLPEYLEETIPEAVVWSNDQNFIKTINNDPAIKTPAVTTGIGLEALLNNQVEMASIDAQINEIMSLTGDNTQAILEGMFKRYAREVFGPQYTAENLLTIKQALDIQ